MYVENAKNDIWPLGENSEHYLHTYSDKKFHFPTFVHYLYLIRLVFKNIKSNLKFT